MLKCSLRHFGNAGAMISDWNFKSPTAILRKIVELQFGTQGRKTDRTNCFVVCCFVIQNVFTSGR